MSKSDVNTFREDTISDRRRRISSDVLSSTFLRGQYQYIDDSLAVDKAIIVLKHGTNGSKPNVCRIFHIPANAIMFTFIECTSA